MNSRRLSTLLVLALGIGSLALGASTAFAGAFTPGAKSLGDPIFPQIGNGGYDVRGYAIDLDYVPAFNRFEADTQTTIDRERHPGPLPLQPRLPA